VGKKRRNQRGTSSSRPGKNERIAMATRFPAKSQERSARVPPPPYFTEWMKKKLEKGGGASANRNASEA